MNLNRYDPKSKCPKCDSEQVHERFLDSGHLVPELMKRTCRWCKYEWFELPLDAAEEQVTPTPRQPV